MYKREVLVIACVCVCVCVHLHVWGVCMCVCMNACMHVCVLTVCVFMTWAIVPHCLDGTASHRNSGPSPTGTAANKTTTGTIWVPLFIINSTGGGLPSFLPNQLKHCPSS